MQKSTVPAPRSIVIQTLSRRLYSSLASAIREVVSNASDAGATRLDITFHCEPTAAGPVHHLTFTDDGEGMSFDESDPDNSEFVNYLIIGGASRRERTGRTETSDGKPLIGFMGVGSLAVAPWCDRITVLTKKKGTRRALYASVPFRKFFDDRRVQREAITSEYEYDWEWIEVPEDQEDQSWTTLDMVGLNQQLVQELSEPLGDSGVGLLEGGLLKYTGRTPRGGRQSFVNYSGLVRFIHELALVVPVEYPDGAPVSDPPRRVLAAEVRASLKIHLTPRVS
jgi:hypothetical protein